LWLLPLSAGNQQRSQRGSNKVNIRDGGKWGKGVGIQGYGWVWTGEGGHVGG